MKWFSATTYASVGNVGPGFDAFGLCLTQPFDQYSVRLIEGGSSVLESVSGLDADKVPTITEENCALIAAEALLESQGIQKHVAMTIRRNIPISGGLGSSAAASVGGALATARAIGKGLDTQLILSSALKGEVAIAGMHLDNIAPCLLGGLTVVLETCPPKVHKFALPENKWKFVFVKPNVELKTKDARKVLPDREPTAHWTKYLAYASSSLAHFISGNEDGFRDSFHDFFAQPHRKKLIPNFDDISAMALANESTGFTISGAGPTMMAVFATGQAADSFEARAKNAFPNYLIFQSSVNNKGAIEP